MLPFQLVFVYKIKIQQYKITPFNFVRGDFEYELGAL
jgi:hypothetical protein